MTECDGVVLRARECDAAMSWEEREEQPLSLDQSSTPEEPREGAESPSRMPPLLYRVRLTDTPQS